MGPIIILFRNQGGQQKQSSHSSSALPQITGVSVKGSGAPTCDCHLEDTALDSLTLRTSRACVHRFNGIAANKNILKELSPQGSEERGKTEIAISKSSPERGIFEYFKSCCPRV